MGWHSTEPFYWRLWLYAPGTLRLLARADGGTKLRVGEHLPRGKIGYIVDDASKEKNEDYLMAHRYLDNYAECTVVEVLKNDGDQIESLDRLYMIHQDA